MIVDFTDKQLEQVKAGLMRRRVNLIDNIDDAKEDIDRIEGEVKELRELLHCKKDEQEVYRTELIDVEASLNAIKIVEDRRAKHEN